MSTSVLTGTLGHEDVLTSKQMRDVSKGLYMKYQNISPLTSLLMKMPKGRKATNPKVEWHYNEELPRWDTISSVSGASGATITVTPSNVSYFKVGDVVEIPQLNPSATQTDVGVVTTKTTTIVITAVGWQSNGSSTAATFPTVTAGMKLHIITDASEENSTAATMKVRQTEAEWNYISFKRCGYKIGNIEQEQAQYTGKERKQRKMETHRDIRIQCEEDLFHGERYYRDGTDGRQFFMRGFRRYLEQGGGSNLLDWSSGLTEEKFDAYLLKGPCQAGIGSPTARFGFFSNDLYLAILKIGKDKERIVGQQKILGQDFTIYLAPGGIKLYMKVHHLLKEEHEGAGLIVDPTRARIRPYGSRGQLEFHPEIQENDRAGVWDEWWTLFSLEVDTLHPHGWIYKG